MSVRRIALLGILTAATIVIAILESFIPSIGIPGVKLGLANIMILVILYELGIVDAIMVNLLRVIVVGLVRGNIFSMGLRRMAERMWEASRLRRPLYSLVTTWGLQNWRKHRNSA